jgi:glutamate N-acetyltransferase/amino-acid N-acetyltransferase
MEEEAKVLYEKEEGGLTFPQGFHAAGVSCGIKEGGYKDIGIVFSDTPCVVAAAFTQNKVKAAPVLLDMQRLKNKISAIIVNSGNANCLTGKKGEEDALTMATETEKKLNLKPGSVLVASTGVIGEYLNMDRILYGINRITRNINYDDNYLNFSHSIMTTDTRTKNVAYSFKLGGKAVKIGLTAKGAGMIKPVLAVPHATMLVFITTDAKIAKPLLEKALEKAIEVSFNRISVDNDTSTNDSVFLLANELAGNAEIVEENDDYRTFCEVLTVGCTDMAKLLVKDGEGASKLIKITINNAMTAGDAEKAARAIADSYLVKTAMFGGSPNWGRIVSALGYSGAKFDVSKLKLYINDLVIYENNTVNRPNKSQATSEMIPNEIHITLDLNLGNKSYFMWTCDLTYDYVKINAHYIS